MGYGIHRIVQASYEGIAWVRSWRIMNIPFRRKRCGVKRRLFQRLGAATVTCFSSWYQSIICKLKISRYDVVLHQCCSSRSWLEQQSSYRWQEIFVIDSQCFRVLLLKKSNCLSFLLIRLMSRPIGRDVVLVVPWCMTDCPVIYFSDICVSLLVLERYSIH